MPKKIVPKPQNKKKTPAKKVVRGCTFRESTKDKEKIEKYVEGLAHGKSKKQAALSAGYASTTSRNAGQKIESTQAFKNAIGRLKVEIGNRVDLMSLLATNLIAGLQSTKGCFVKDDDGEVSYFKTEELDNKMFLEHLKELSKLFGWYKPQQVEISKSNDFSHLSAEELHKIIEECDEELAQLEQ